MRKSSHYHFGFFCCLLVAITACGSSNDKQTETPGVGGATSHASTSATGGLSSTSSTTTTVSSMGGTTSSTMDTASGGTTVATSGGATGGNAAGGYVGTTVPSHKAAFPFPLNRKPANCHLPTVFGGTGDAATENEQVRKAYEDWKTATITAEGAGGFLRVMKPDSGSIIGSTVSEGIGYGMILAAYFDDQAVFDGLWKYEQSYLDANGLMNWEIGPTGKVTSGGKGAATDGDEDMAFALIMADKQWGGSGSLNDTYLNHAKRLIDLIYKYEVDTNEARLGMLLAGDSWGAKDVTNPSYFAPAYFRIFGQVTGKVTEWNKVIEVNYDILERSLNAASGNQDNGLVPAWCNFAGVPTKAYTNAPLNYQQDSTRTPFRIGQDYCFFGAARAKAYLDKIGGFFAGIGVANIKDGYALNGDVQEDTFVPTDKTATQAASFVGPAGVAFMSSPDWQTHLDEAFAAVATLKLMKGTIYYQKSWAALSLLMMSGNLADPMTLVP